MKRLIAYSCTYKSIGAYVSAHQTYPPAFVKSRFHLLRWSVLLWLEPFLGVCQMHCSIVSGPPQMHWSPNKKLGIDWVLVLADNRIVTLSFPLTGFSEHRLFTCIFIFWSGELTVWLFSLHHVLAFFFLCTEHSNKPFTRVTFLRLNSKSLRKVLLL